MILLLGSGYVASAFARELKARQLEFMQLSRSGFDYTSFEKLNWYFRDHRFGFVINAAGYCGQPNVDACEEHKEEAFAGNVRLALAVAYACAGAIGGITGSGIPLGHVSSGCIYNGEGPFAETDEPNFSFERPPCSYYSGTKALAEKLIAGVGRCYLWRLRIPFNEHDGPKNYLSKLLRYPRLISLPNSLSHLGDYVKACLDLWQAGAPYGIYNVTNPGSASALEITAAMNHALNLGRRFEFYEDLDEFNQMVIAPRSNCVLSVEKLLSTGVKIRPVWEALGEAINHWKPA